MAFSRAATGPLELPHLATFARVAELARFTAAAAELGITQAAVSQRIAALEKELRVSLFVRRAGRIRLTEAGLLLHEYSRKIIDLHAEARQALGGRRLLVSGDLQVAASSVPGECFLPRLLPAFQAAFPKVRVRATVSGSGSVLKDIETGRATVGLVGRRTENPRLDSRPIASDCLVLIVAPQHRWARRRTIALADLARQKLIIREFGSGSRWDLERGLERAGTSLAALNVVLELGSNEAIKDAVRRGVGIAFLSRLAVRREVRSKELRSPSIAGLDLKRQYYVVFDRRRPLSPVAGAFVHFLETHPPGIDRP
jgi:DNA-binding transcriptional LysR family regulator